MGEPIENDDGSFASSHARGTFCNSLNGASIDSSGCFVSINPRDYDVGLGAAAGEKDVKRTFFIHTHTISPSESIQMHRIMLMMFCSRLDLLSALNLHLKRNCNPVPQFHHRRVAQRLERASHLTANRHAVASIVVVVQRYLACPEVVELVRSLLLSLDAGTGGHQILRPSMKTHFNVEEEWKEHKSFPKACFRTNEKSLELDFLYPHACISKVHENCAPS